MPLHLRVVPALADTVAPVVALLRAPVADPFAPEWVVAPTQGVHLWLGERLAHALGATPGRHDGIAANIRMAFPGALVTEALGGRMHDDPWGVPRLTMALLDLLHQHPALVPATRRHGGLLAAARALADRFDRYHVHRPAMIEAWARGHDVLVPLLDAPPEPVPEAQQWQPALWRAVRERLGAPSPPERTRAGLARLQGGEAPAGLPSRVLVVGATALAPLHLEVLLALAAHVTVHAWLVHPSPGVLHATLRRLQPVLRDAGTAVGTPRRFPAAEHPVRTVARLPLLDGWVRPSQGMQLLLAAHGVAVDAPDAVAPPDLVAPSDPVAPMSVLQRLQRAIRLDAPTADQHAPPLDDQSLRVHGCHGAARQVEVLREALLQAFRELPGLRPEQVLVVAPNLPAMAPQLEAVFGAARPGEHADAWHLPLTVADRALREDNEVAEALLRLVACATGRFGRADLGALTELAVVRRRFGVDADTVRQWLAWADRLQVAWGVDGAHRAPFGLAPAFTAHSWRHAAQRLAYGALVADAAPAPALGGVVPATGADTGDLPAVGALCALLDTVGALAAEALGPARPVREWMARLHAAVHAVADVPRDGQPALAVTLAQLAAVRDEAAPSDTPVPFAELLPLLQERVGGAPGRVLLRGGTITATSLVPLRGVPYRVVCVVGMDEGAFAAGGSEGDDLLREPPLVGDPDPRAEQRQALLEAVLAAQERLIVTHTAFSVRSGKPVPPIAPLAELRQLLRSAGVKAEAVEVLHPRHGMDPRTFTPGVLGTPGPFGHLVDQRDALRRTAGAPTPAVDADATDAGGAAGPGGIAAPALVGAVGTAPQVVTLEDLALFLDNPVALYVRRTLGIDVYEREDAAGAVIPLELEWRAEGDAAGILLDRIRGARDRDTVVAEEAPAWRTTLQREGMLPPGCFAARVFGRLEGLVEALRVQCHQKDKPLVQGTPLPLSWSWGDGVVLSGTVPGVHELPDGTRAIVHVGTRPHALDDTSLALAQLWLLAACTPGHAVSSWWIGSKDGAAGADGVRELGTYATKGASAVDQRDAHLHALRALLPLYREALVAPRPRFGKTAEQAVTDRTKAARTFGQVRGRLQPWHPEARVYGLAPRFGDIFPDGGDVVRFFTRLQGVLAAGPQVGNCRAKAGRKK
jgi:exodeoxyribonuclease V gamma subunit